MRTFAPLHVVPRSMLKQLRIYKDILTDRNVKCVKYLTSFDTLTGCDTEYCVYSDFVFLRCLLRCQKTLKDFDRSSSECFRMFCDYKVAAFIPPEVKTLAKHVQRGTIPFFMGFKHQRTALWNSNTSQQSFM